MDCQLERIQVPLSPSVSDGRPPLGIRSTTELTVLRSIHDFFSAIILLNKIMKKIHYYLEHFVDKNVADGRRHKKSAGQGSIASHSKSTVYLQSPYINLWENSVCLNEM